MSTQKECVTCRQRIGVAAKTCQHCRAKQPYKTKLEAAKKKFNNEWKDTQTKNHSINKVYDSTNLLLHKWNLLERHPVLLLGKRIGQRFVAECLCPHEMNTAQEKNALLAIQRIYESLLNGDYQYGHQRSTCHQSTCQVMPQQLLVCKEEVPPEQQECSSSLDQEEPEPPHIKEEQEELWTNQEAEQLQDLTKFPFTAVTVKSEDDEEEAQCSQFHQSQTEENREAEPPASSSTEQMKTEADGEEPARNSDPAADFQATSEGQLLSSHSSEAETDDSDDWEESREPQSGSNPQSELLFTDDGSDDAEKPSSCSVIKIGGEKVWRCSLCGKSSKHKKTLKAHLKIHTVEKPCSCSICGKSYRWKGELKNHMRVHTGEKPFSCSVCNKSFAQKRTLTMHMQIHTGEKSFMCSDCGKIFQYKHNLTKHTKVHTGEKPYMCSVCFKGFSAKRNLTAHMRIHTGEKPYQCSVCDKGFRWKGELNNHTRVHTGPVKKKTVNCSVSGKDLTVVQSVSTHTVIHTENKSAVQSQSLLKVLVIKLSDKAH